MAIETGGPAFPTEIATTNPNQAGFTMSTGLSVRDYFAAEVIQSLIRAAWSTENRTVSSLLDTWAVDSYRIADAMIRARG